MHVLMQTLWCFLLNCSYIPSICCSLKCTSRQTDLFFFVCLFYIERGRVSCYIRFLLLSASPLGRFSPLSVLGYHRETKWGEIQNFRVVSITKGKGKSSEGYTCFGEHCLSWNSPNFWRIPLNFLLNIWKRKWRPCTMQSDCIISFTSPKNYVI